jgi:hypothetical protein
MPKTLTFVDCLGFKMPDYDDEVDDDHDSDYTPDSDTDSDDDSSTNDASSTDNDSLGPDDDNPGDDGPNNDIVPPRLECRWPTGVVMAHANHDDDDEDMPELATRAQDDDGDDDSDDDSNDSGNDRDDDDDSDDDDKNEGNSDDAGNNNGEDDIDGMSDHDAVNEGEPEVLGGIAGVPGKIPGVDTQEQIEQQMDEKYGPCNHDINLRPQRLLSYDHLHAYLDGEFLVFMPTMMMMMKTCQN